MVATSSGIKICFSSSLRATALTLLVWAVLSVGSAAAQAPRASDLEFLASTSSTEGFNSLFDTRRLRAAERILAVDSSNAVALTELARHHAANYRWYANMIAAKQPIGGGLRKSSYKAFNRSLDYYGLALTSDPILLDAADGLIRILIEEGRLEEAELQTRHLTRRAPDIPRLWMLRGLVAQLRDQPARAQRFFDRALTNMPDDRAQDYRSTALFLADKFEEARRNADPRRFDASFWISRDPLFLTPENERLADHFARMIYADLWYGTSGTVGWETERGSIITRYGFPEVDMTFTATLSRFNVLNFGEFDFVFEDQTRGGHYTLYSPKAGAGSSWAFDYVIRAGEMERELPERFRFQNIARTAVHSHVARFRGERGQTDVYLLYAVPVERFSPDRSGPRPQISNRRIHQRGRRNRHPLCRNGSYRELHVQGDPALRVRRVRVFT